MNKAVVVWLITLTALVVYPYIRDNKKGELQRIQFSRIIQQTDYNTNMIGQHVVLIRHIMELQQQ